MLLEYKDAEMLEQSQQLCWGFIPCLCELRIPLVRGTISFLLYVLAEVWSIVQQLNFTNSKQLGKLCSFFFLMDLTP